MKYKTEAMFREDELQDTTLTQEVIYKNLVRRMINNMPIQELEKVFDLGWEWDGIDTAIFYAEIETDK